VANHLIDAQAPMGAIGEIPFDGLPRRQANECRPDRRQYRDAANATTGLLGIDEVQVLTRTAGLIGVENLGIHRHDVGQDRNLGRDDGGAVDFAQ
jgi:hypothetical protein